jgi:glutamate N-acetyltransferase / amino-acid N-acetyltransferase
VSVVAADGFVASGVACGIKPSGDTDLALVATAEGAPAAAAGAFTQNLVVAAPVTVSRRHLAATGGRAAAVVLSSGNANAATGERGELDAEGVCALTADGLGCPPESVLVCATGLIGLPLPMGLIATGVPRLVVGRGGDPVHGIAAAEAIMTTDTRRKETVMRGEGSSSAGWGTVVSRGCVGVEHDTGAVAAHMAGEYLEVLCDLAVGEGEARVLTNDLTYGYIDENRGTS